jgi:hypothetical protein
MKSAKNPVKVAFILILLISGSSKLLAGPLYINEILASNTAYYAGNTAYVDWIEIYNDGTVSIDLGGYFLTDEKTRTDKWIIPAGTVIAAKGFKVFYADERNFNLHTNFRLSVEGEFIGLYNAQGTVVDSITYKSQRNNISFGRSSSNLSELGFFQKPTPGNLNGGITYPSILEKPQFSSKSGFYASALNITLTSIEGAIIRYTTNGSEPILTSDIYTGAINIELTTCIRAKAFKDGLLESEINTHTFFIGVSKSLPVISLVTNNENLFSDTAGIYVIGTNGIRAGCSSTPMNLNQNWERAVNVELFDEQGNVQINQLAGIRIFGGCSRQRYPIKSFEVFARRMYGKGSFDFKLFKTENITRFESFLIRSSSDDQMFTMFRDGLGHTLVSDLKVETQAYQPAVVYINGQYWGIHNIREKYNEAYFEEHYGVAENNLNVIKNNPSSSDNVETGIATHYLNMLAYLSAHATDYNIYEYMNTQMDIESFIDYMASQIYLSADDWPGNNIRYWRANTGKYNRWRWVCYDMDQVVRSNNTRWNSILLATTPYNGNSWPNPPWSVVLFNNLLKGSKFRNEFLQRITFLMNTSFSPEHIIHLVDSIQDNISDEMPYHIQRWGGKLVADPLRESWILPLPRSMEEWENYVQVMRNFAVSRPDTAVNMLRRYFKLSNTVDITISNNNPDLGYLFMGPKRFLTDVHTGKYFANIPIELNAKPKPGYRFLRWEVSQSGLPLIENKTSLLSFIPTKNASITAFFEPDTVGTAPVIINEINYHSADEANAGDWIELYNRAAYSVDISGWIMKDEKDDHSFEIPENVMLPVNAYFVICEDTALFKRQFPKVKKRTGNFAFGLGNSGDCVRLYNQYLEFVDSIHYSDDSPWPPLADGGGSSLALTGPYLDNDLAQSWSDLCWLTPGSKNVLKSEGPLIVINPAMDPNNGDYWMNQNYPNPCIVSTTIDYGINEGGNVSLVVYDLSGRIVRTLVSEFQHPDSYKVTFNMDDLQSGTYFYSLKVGNLLVKTRKMIVL